MNCSFCDSSATRTKILHKKDNVSIHSCVEHTHEYLTEEANWHYARNIVSFRFALNICKHAMYAFWMEMYGYRGPLFEMPPQGELDDLFLTCDEAGDWCFPVLIDGQVSARRFRDSCSGPQLDNILEHLNTGFYGPYGSKK
jgi:hypothetical protein